MSNEYGIKRTFVVYRIIQTGRGIGDGSAYSLQHVRELESQEEANLWIEEEGDRHIPYTILEVVRKN